MAKDYTTEQSHETALLHAVDSPADQQRSAKQEEKAGSTKSGLQRFRMIGMAVRALTRWRSELGVH